MICYRDMTFCEASCGTTDCPSKFTEADRLKAVAWWGDINPPVAFSDFSGTCEAYTQPSGAQP